MEQKMNEQEAFKLLTLASARDGRTVTQSVAAIWANDLDRVNLTDAAEALTLHYRESTAWAMPHHIIAGVRRVRDAYDREQRKLRALPAPNVVTIPDDFAEMTRKALAQHRAARAAVES